MNISDMVPWVLAELPGATEFIVERMFREELANLYRNHALWLYTDPAAAVATTGVVTFTLPTCTEVHEVRSMRIGDEKVTPVGEASLNLERLENDIETPRYVMRQNDQWVARPKPGEATTAHCVLQIGPVMNTECVDDNLAARHRTLWEHAVLARMCSQARQTWTNTRAASLHASEFTRLVFEEKRRLDGWSARRAPVVAYGGI